MMSFVKNIQTVFTTDTVNESDSGEGLVTEIIMISGLAIAAIFTINIVGNVIKTKAAETAKCIEASNGFGDTSQACKNAAKSVRDKAEAAKRNVDNNDAYKEFMGEDG